MIFYISEVRLDLDRRTLQKKVTFLNFLAPFIRIWRWRYLQLFHYIIFTFVYDCLPRNIRNGYTDFVYPMVKTINYVLSSGGLVDGQLHWWLAVCFRYFFHRHDDPGHHNMRKHDRGQLKYQNVFTIYVLYDRCRSYRSCLKSSSASHAKKHLKI